MMKKIKAWLKEVLEWYMDANALRAKKLRDKKDGKSN